MLAEEIEVRERSVNTSAGSQSTTRKRSTSATFIAGNHLVTCIYCPNNHQAEQCQLMTQPEARKQFLRGAGRCFVCLKKGHVSAKYRSGVRYTKCIGPPHHVSICGRKKPRSSGRVETGKRTVY